MQTGSISTANTAAFELRTPGPIGHEKIEDAARQFEALLMGELLRASQGDDSGWLGTGEDSSMSSAMQMAQEHFAQALAAQGGIGITQYVKEHLAQIGE